MIAIILIVESTSAVAGVNSSCKMIFSNQYSKEKIGDLIQEKFVIDMKGPTFETLPLNVPKGVGSIQIDILGSHKKIYFLSALNDPEGIRLVTDDMAKIPKPSEDYLESLKSFLGNVPDVIPAFLSPVRSIPGYFNGFASLAITSELSSGLKIKPGKYEFRIGALKDEELTDHQVHVRVTYKPLMPKKAPAILPLRILFSGARGWNENHSEYNEVISRMNRILEPANVKVVVDETGEAPESLTVDSDNQIVSLFNSLRPTKRPALNVILAKETYLESYGKVYGFSPGIPGPLTEGNFKNFGVVVGIGETFTQPTHELAIVLTHEILHYLGLSHTYEIKSAVCDVYSDTNANEFTSNIMDPEPSRIIEYPELSEMQINSLRYHPLVILSH